MRFTPLLLAFLFLTTYVAAQQAVKPSPLEQKYGDNLARIRAEAEALWIRDNIYILYDHQDRENHYVSMLTDREIIHILKSEESRKRTGINQADLLPYIEEVAGEVPEGLKDIEKLPPEEETVEPTVEKPAQTVPESRIQCVRENKITIFDPLYRNNRWVSMLSDEELSRIISKNSVLGC